MLCFMRLLLLLTMYTALDMLLLMMVTCVSYYLTDNYFNCNVIPLSISDVL